MSTCTLIEDDCLAWMKRQPSKSVNLCFGSPPYEDARTYGMGFKLKGQDWVDWMVERIVEAVRITDGLVAMVVEGKTNDFQWSCTPALLMADLHRSGIRLRKPPVFHRVGIPGSGGPDWLRNDFEFIVCCTGAKWDGTEPKLPWSDPTALGHPPKWAPGGAMSNRTVDGTRINEKPWGEGGFLPETKKGDAVRRRVMTIPRAVQHGGQENTSYAEPVKANPGNVLKYNVGGGVMGSQLCHENEAPFPEQLAEFFVRSFCPPNGTTLDIFSGSGTTCAMAVKHGRNAIGVDVRESQIKLAARRLREEHSCEPVCILQPCQQDQPGQPANAPIAPPDNSPSPAS